jgi:hypothetical protein
MKTKSKSITKREMSKAELDLIERDVTMRKGLLVKVVAVKKAPDTENSVVLIKKCGHTPRVATKRPMVRCMQCRPTSYAKLSEGQRTALSNRAAAIRRRYNGKGK